MTAFHAAQVALAAVAAALIVARLRALFFVAPLPVRPLRRMLESRVRRGDLTRALALAEHARPAWIAEAAAAVLRARVRGKDPLSAVEPMLLDLHYEAGRGLWAIRVLATIASAMGLLGALAALMNLLYGDHGLTGLVRGLPERLAFERALLSMLIGMSTAGVCLYAWRLLRRRARRLLDDVREVTDALVEAPGVVDPEDAP